MATTKRKTGAAKKTATPRAIKSGTVQTPPAKKRGPGTITDRQFASVMRHLETWIQERAGGEKLSGRKKAEMLGVAQSEWNDWERDHQRPGLPKLIFLRERTGIPLEVMLGLI